MQLIPLPLKELIVKYPDTKDSGLGITVIISNSYGYQRVEKVSLPVWEWRQPDSISPVNHNLIKYGVLIGQAY